MERLCRLVCACVLLQLLAPAPAHAWWDWLEEFSGPGPWKGLVFGARLMCFVAERAEPDDTTLGFMAQLDEESQKRAKETEVQRIRGLGAAGLVYSACGLDERRRDDINRDVIQWRRASIELGMRFLWTHDERFANGRRISLTTIEPSFSWSLIDNPSGNVIDYRIGAGFYWVSSREFPSVTGTFLEPVRLDIHAPRKSPKWARIPLFRIGLLVFPRGFEPDVFLPRPDVKRRVSRDWVRYWGIYTDMDAVIKCLKDPRNCGSI